MPAALDPGELDRRLTIRRATTVLDAANTPVEQWGDVAVVWAKKTDVSDGEKVRAQQVGATITTRFLIRWSRAMSAVGPTYRLRCGGLEYEISGVKEVGRREGLEITAVARADGVPL